MRLGNGDTILPADDGNRPGNVAVGDVNFKSLGCFSSLLAISASDHIRGLLFRLWFVLPPGVCFISTGGR